MSSHGSYAEAGPAPRAYRRYQRLGLRGAYIDLGMSSHGSYAEAGMARELIDAINDLD